MSSLQCAGYTQKGERCQRSPESGSIYCWQHQNYEEKMMDLETNFKRINLKEKKVKKKDVDEDWDWLKNDQYYYGKIPKNTDFNKLVDIMADALTKVYIDAANAGQVITVDELSSLLDLWLEHDSNSENQFDYLVPDDQSLQFYDKVEEKLRKRGIK